MVESPLSAWLKFAIEPPQQNERRLTLRAGKRLHSLADIARTPQNLPQQARVGRTEIDMPDIGRHLVLLSLGQGSKSLSRHAPETWVPRLSQCASAPVMANRQLRSFGDAAIRTLFRPQSPTIYRQSALLMSAEMNSPLAIAALLQAFDHGCTGIGREAMMRKVGAISPRPFLLRGRRRVSSSRCPVLVRATKLEIARHGDRSRIAGVARRNRHRA